MLRMTQQLLFIHAFPLRVPFRVLYLDHMKEQANTYNRFYLEKDVESGFQYRNVILSNKAYTTVFSTQYFK